MASPVHWSPSPRKSIIIHEGWIGPILPGLVLLFEHKTGCRDLKAFSFILHLFLLWPRTYYRSLLVFCNSSVVLDRVHPHSSMEAEVSYTCSNDLRSFSHFFLLAEKLTRRPLNRCSNAKVLSCQGPLCTYLSMLFRLYSLPNDKWQQYTGEPWLAGPDCFTGCASLMHIVKVLSVQLE